MPGFYNTNPQAFQILDPAAVGELADGPRKIYELRQKRDAQRRAEAVQLMQVLPEVTAFAQKQKALKAAASVASVQIMSLSSRIKATVAVGDVFGEATLQGELLGLAGLPGATDPETGRSEGARGATFAELAPFMPEAMKVMEHHLAGMNRPRISMAQLGFAKEVDNVIITEPLAPDGPNNDVALISLADILKTTKSGQHHLSVVAYAVNNAPSPSDKERVARHYGHYYDPKEQKLYGERESKRKIEALAITDKADADLLASEFVLRNAKRLYVEQRKFDVLRERDEVMSAIALREEVLGRVLTIDERTEEHKAAVARRNRALDIKSDAAATEEAAGATAEARRDRVAGDIVAAAEAQEAGATAVAGDRRSRAREDAVYSQETERLLLSGKMEMEQLSEVLGLEFEAKVQPIRENLERQIALGKLSLDLEIRETELISDLQRQGLSGAELQVAVLMHYQAKRPQEFELAKIVSTSDYMDPLTGKTRAPSRAEALMYHEIRTSQVAAGAQPAIIEKALANAGFGPKGSDIKSLRGFAPTPERVRQLSAEVGAGLKTQFQVFEELQREEALTTGALPPSAEVLVERYARSVAGGDPAREDAIVRRYYIEKEIARLESDRSQNPYRTSPALDSIYEAIDSNFMFSAAGEGAKRAKQIQDTGEGLISPRATKTELLELSRGLRRGQILLREGGEKPVLKSRESLSAHISTLRARGASDSEIAGALLVAKDSRHAGADVQRAAGDLLSEILPGLSERYGLQISVPDDTSLSSTRDTLGRQRAILLGNALKEADAAGIPSMIVPPASYSMTPEMRVMLPDLAPSVGAQMVRQGQSAGAKIVNAPFPSPGDPVPPGTAPNRQTAPGPNGEVLVSDGKTWQLPQ